MNNEHVIFDTPLPESQNFHWLKAKGIEYAQKLSSSLWTNFNDSDPGVTILDQLCYALTELGYCNDFSIEDILTHADGQIKFQDQFYLPDEILTCSPVTIDDYRKLILDYEPLVKNVYITLDETILGCYQTYLYLEEEADTTVVQQSVYALLMQYRNLAEMFYKPIILSAKNITLTGAIKLHDKVVSGDVLSKIQLAINHYISPSVLHYGYHDMQEMGLNSDEIFNGPRLNNGWIPSAGFSQPKRNTITINELFAVVAKVEGVQSVSELKFKMAEIFIDDVMTIEIAEIAKITSELSIESISSISNTPLVEQLSFELLKLQQSHQATKIGAATDIAPTPPEGNYRNIESYYSIQNTFPPIYAIGTESLIDNSNDYRTAQSRQLKGYLMVFDQLLANQFSQLANVATLFSFKSETTIAPKQGATYDGIPYQLFSPTYFCQPLYHIPNVKPLLLGHDTYRISITPSNESIEEAQAWQRYQADPFNQYIQGLRQNMENDAQRDDRRNRMLNHLLARHGESATFYDEIISTARWYGSTLKTRIILKSILLQNYRALSYHRTKAYSLFQAQKLDRPTLTFQPFEKDNNFNDYHLISDGQLNLEKLEALEQLDKQDFDDYATVELQINLLLGLRQHYQLLAELLFALIQNAQFEDWLKNTSSTLSAFEFIDNDITICVTKQQVGTNYENHISFSGQQVLCIKRADNNAPQLDDYQAHLGQIQWLGLQRRGILLLEPLLLLEPYGCAIKEIEKLGLTAKQFYLRTLLIYPDYITLFSQTTFQQNLEKLSRVYLPAHIDNDIIPASFTTLQKIIPAFIYWYLVHKLKSI